MDYVTSTFRLPTEMYEKIRKEAYDKKVSLAEVIRQACDFYFDAQAKASPALEVRGETIESNT